MKSDIDTFHKARQFLDQNEGNDLNCQNEQHKLRCLQCVYLLFALWNCLYFQRKVLIDYDISNEDSDQKIHDTVAKKPKVFSKYKREKPSNVNHEEKVFNGPLLLFQRAEDKYKDVVDEGSNQASYPKSRLVLQLVNDNSITSEDHKTENINSNKITERIVFTH